MRVINGISVPHNSFTPKENETFYAPIIGGEKGSEYILMTQFKHEHHSYLRALGVCYPATEEGKAAVLLHLEALTNNLNN